MYHPQWRQALVEVGRCDLLQHVLIPDDVPVMCAIWRYSVETQSRSVANIDRIARGQRLAIDKHDVNAECCKSFALRWRTDAATAWFLEPAFGGVLVAIVDAVAIAIVVVGPES